MITANEMRSMFLDYFKGRAHEIVSSSTVVPHGDPTLLFTNSGMNQFKNIFLGLEDPGFKRAASVQKCIRASGKHNDLEDVGKDGRHHTFFEMLGNWSFGDYYKREAIEWGWEFVTEKMGLQADRLWVSVYSRDKESFDVWRRKVGVPEERIVKLGNLDGGDEENFWSMGETGPCGPCSEIHYDYAPPRGKGSAKGRSFAKAAEAGEIIELWNLVFMEFNRQADGRLVPLPQRNVDTGMGLERAAAILQGVTSNYDTDLFVPIMEELEAISGVSFRGGDHLVSFRVVADHIRALAFAVADGAAPSNEGRGYVLRRILRRAVRHGRLLGLGEPFLHRLVGVLARIMGEQYRELLEKRAAVERVILGEEELFLRTLDRGIEEFGRAARRLKERGQSVFPGEEAFLLHDTYGFPLDLTEVMAAEEGLTVDRGGFEREMNSQRERAQTASRFQLDVDQGEWISLGVERGKTVFAGYGATELAGMRLVKYKPLGGQLLLVFDRTPFYGEQGGQAGDTGTIEGNGTRIRVSDAKKTGDLIVHFGVLEAGELKDVEYRGTVDAARRRKIMANHTATHLLHYALRETLGSHVTQAGSLVLPDKLRFDFNHYGPLSNDQLAQVESLVNGAVLQNLPVNVFADIPIGEAKAMGAMALFGEKYGKRVRVVRVDAVSAELCGGTHVERTGDIGFFKVVKESSISAGVRRIEAVTNVEALALVKTNEALLEEAAGLLKTGYEGVPERIRGLQERIQTLEKQLKSDRRRGAGDVFEPSRDVRKAGKFNAALLKLTGHQPDEMREMTDKVKSKLAMGVVLAVSRQAGEGGEEKVSVVLAASEDAVAAGVRCGALLQEILAGFGGRGGGRPHLAQGAFGSPGPSTPGASGEPGAVDAVFEALIGLLERM
jgi:alanyl-tRNA synthetase